MKLAALTILFFLFAFAGCAAVMDTDTAPRDDDRASITPGTPTPPTATPTPGDFPQPSITPTINPDREGITLTPCGFDDCTTPTETRLPDDIYLTALAGTPSQTPDINDRATHAALEQTMEAGQ